MRTGERIDSIEITIYNVCILWWKHNSYELTSLRMPVRRVVRWLLTHPLAGQIISKSCSFFTRVYISHFGLKIRIFLRFASPFVKKSLNSHPKHRDKTRRRKYTGTWVECPAGYSPFFFFFFFFIWQGVSQLANLLIILTVHNGI